MIISCIAIDDEPKALSVIENHVSNSSNLQLRKIFLDPFEALSYLKSEKIDLIFLDIDMPTINGVEFLKSINSTSLVIFTTAYSDYAINAYELDAVDFLLKPFDLIRFKKAVEKVTKKLNQLSNESLFLNTGTHMQKIFVSDILYLESAGNYINYVTKNESFLIRSTVKEALNNLDSKQFIQIHRSIVVAINQISKVDDHSIYIKHKKLSIGETFKQNIKKLNFG